MKLEQSKESKKYTPFADKGLYPKAVNGRYFTFKRTKPYPSETQKDSLNYVEPTEELPF